MMDASYLLDAHDWIAEALGMMKTTYGSSFMFEDVDVRFHAAPMPCHLLMLLGVEYEGRRLRYSATMRHPRAAASSVVSKGSPDLFTAIPTVETVGDHQFYTTTFQELKNLDYCGDYYTFEPGQILTSFECGPIRIHFKGIPVDSDGLPMIPDNENLKQALYYYVRAQMCGAGWPDKVLGFDRCIQMFETIGRRGINQIKQETPDMKENSMQNQVRFAPPEGYYEQFFSNTRGEGEINLY